MGIHRDRAVRQFTRRGLIKATGTAAAVAGTSILLPTGATRAATIRARQTPKKGGTLVAGLNQESATIDPHKSRDGAGSQMKGVIYSQLLKYYYDKKIVNDLAESYDAVDPVTYVFHLRKGVKFHDGAELTAADVVASYERILDPATGALMRPFLTSVDKVTAKDDYTVEFKLKQPYGPFLSALALRGNSIAQKKKIDAKVNFETDVVGTGPFKLASRNPGVETKVERNPNYFLPNLPYLDGITFHPIFDDSARMNALFSGDADLVTYVTWASMKKIEDDKNYVLESNKEDGFVLVEFRVDQKPLTDPKLRQAISLGINRDAIIATATSGRGKASGGGLIPSWMPGYDANLAKTYAFNPDKAKQLIEEAGAKGTKIEYISWPPDTELFGRPSVIVANQLKEIGLDVQLKPQPLAEWQQTRAEGTYQMFMDGNLFDMPDPDFLTQYFHSGARIPAANRFSDPEIDKWLDDARQMTDMEKRLPLYQKVQERSLALMPVSLVFFREQGEAWQTKVKGYQYLSSLGMTNALLETWLDS